MKVIVIDGIIGAGKTTYIKVISELLRKEGYKVVVVKEPVDGWVECGILQRFYNDSRRWGYHFQTKAFHDRVCENIKAFEENSDADFFILERSPFTDTLFMELLHDDHVVDDLELRNYGEWWRLWMRVMPYSPDYFLYLKPDVEVCMARLRNRNRDGEAGVGKDYQESLERKHDFFFQNDTVQVLPEKAAKVIRLITNENFRDDEEVQQRLLKEFLRNVNDE